jgi:hypothetical protein
VNFTLTTFDVVFPIGLGVMFGLARYMKFMQSGVVGAAQLAAIDGLKGMAGAGVIMLAYKMLGIL